MLVKEFIRNVVEEKNGFSFDRPHRLGETILSVVVPIVRETKKTRKYITLAEASDVKIEDTGQIDFVYVKNNEDIPLYISRGEIFRGKTQERAAVHGYIVMPDKGARVAVRCIHASKGISSGATMEYGGKVPYDINLNNQSATWSSVSTYSSKLYGNSGSSRARVSPTSSLYVDGGYSPIFTTTLEYDSTVYLSSIKNVDSVNGSINIVASDDLVGTLDNLTDNIREAMKRIPGVENQVGLVFIKENKIQGLDIYDIPDSWKTIKDDVIEKEGSAFIDDSKDIFTFNPEKAVLLIQDILGKEFTEKSIYDKEYRIVEVKYENLVGEAVVFDQDVIHLTMWNKQ